MNMEWISKWRARRIIRNSRYQKQLADMPAGLEAYWRYSAPREYEGIRTDAFFFARAAEGLMQFFDTVRTSSRPCALPSEAADSVWHAWLRWNPAGLERFCLRHFGQAVPHVERAGLGAGALPNTLAACRALEGIAPEGPRLPRLFGLDARLRMPGGHGYGTQSGEIMYARLGPRGRGMWRARPHPELTMQALYAAGLVNGEVLAAHLRRQAAADGSSCGNFSDGACDGGSSCGSSCGGGCGGGGD